MFKKKAFSSVVSTILLILITIFAVSSFQSWFNNYNSELNVKVQSGYDIESLLRVQGIIGNNLYLFLDDPNRNINFLKISNNAGEEMCSFSYNNYSNTENLIGYWSFDLYNSTHVFDESEKGNSGILYAGEKGSGDSGSDSSHCVETNLHYLSYVNDYYNGWTFEVTSGLAKGQKTIIQDYIVYNLTNNKSIVFDNAITGFQSGDGYRIYYGENAIIPQKVDGVYGNAFLFDGKDDFIYFNSSNYLTGLNEISFGAWFNTRNSTGYILLKNGPFASVVANLKLRTSVYTLPEWIYLYSNQSIELNKWYHYFSVYDGSETKIYINGKLSSVISQIGFFAR